MAAYRVVWPAVCATAVLFLANGTEAARGEIIVVPNALTTVEGNVSNGFPFNVGGIGFSAMRYQQVFAASEFASLGDPHFITQIAFRPDAGVGAPFSTTISNILINLSTTSASPDGLSLTFANNVGPNDTVVFSGALSLSSADVDADGLPGGPRAFDILIDLQTPFLYDPSAGNLLLDVRNFSGEPTTQFDAHNLVGDSVSRVASTNVNGATSNITALSIGLVAQFTTTPVPEPSTLTLLGLGTLGLLGYGWRWRKRASA